MPASDDQRLDDPPGQRTATSAGSLVPVTPAVARRATAGLFLALLSLVGLLGLNNLRHGIYVVLYGLVAGAVGVWFAATSVTAARRGKTTRPRGAIAAIVIGALGIVLSAVMLTAFAVLGSQLASYSQCMSGANTISSRQSCQDQFTRAVNHKLNSLRPG